MAKSRKKQWRAAWLQVHKWIGLALALLIIPICLTGSALVWHDWLDAQLESQRHEAIGPARLAPDAYAGAARDVLGPQERVSAIRFSPEGAPVVVTATKPGDSPGARPQRTTVWLDPTDARVIDSASGSSGLVQVMHVMHGSLMIPGWGRPLVGWVGAFMLVSCISGLWLWWPLSGSFRRGLKWRRRNSPSANLHYQLGFWVLVPLAMLSFTGVWISFPKVFAGFEPGRPAASSPARNNARPLEAPAMTGQAALAAAQPFATGHLLTITWPTEQKREWKVAFEREGDPAEVLVSDRDATATAPEPPRPETLARTMRRWHDGTGMGPVWQVVIFFGGLIPAGLAVTGVMIWLRSRRARGKAKGHRASLRQLQPAE